MAVVIMAGGTGGHVFPALAVAGALRARGASVTWMGTRRGLEARLVPAAGIPVDWIAIAGLRGKGALAWILAPVRLLLALLQALAILLRRKPRVVLGMGGFVTGPGGVAAWLLRRPLVIHEQNAVAGMTNRYLARLATRVLEAFPGSFPNGRAGRLTGNPVRPEIARLPPPTLRLAGRTGRPRLLVFGGSLGAQVLNETVPVAVALMPAELRPEIWHQSGQGSLDAAQAAYARAGLDVRLDAFIDDMAAAYAWADLVLCRAGALTVAELAAAGVAAVLVPYPHAVDDHQTGNARFLAEAGAAELIPQDRLTAPLLADRLTRLLGDRAQLTVMAEAAHRLGRPEAVESVVTECLAAAGVSG
jgi:UDP-N-acetylglucosamine--N-acetylmuramyl-(pentapeptide) pyrophosphoryl-undecaprenol N-acetylglucosamine transferase